MNVKAALAKHGRAIDRSQLDRLFSIDLRGLALVRIGLSSLLAIESTRRLIEQQPWRPVALLLLAVALALGFRTRPITMAAWAILATDVRADLLDPTQSVDLSTYVLVLGLFWGMFLPLGARLSLDAGASNLAPGRTLSVASGGVLVQVFLIYFSAGATKDFGEWIADPRALETIFLNPRHGNDFAIWLTQFPVLLMVLSVATIVLEVVGPILLFVPGSSLASRRTLLVFAFIAFHGGMAATMSLGLFPFVSMVLWLMFLPPTVWDRLFRTQSSRIALTADGNNLRTVLASTGILLIVVSTILTWFFYPGTEGLPGVIQDVARNLALYQQWVMFSVPSTL